MLGNTWLPSNATDMEDGIFQSPGRDPMQSLYYQ